MNRKVILYIAMSLDGYIAKTDDNIDFLTKVDAPGEDYGYASFLKEVDTVIWGRKTYEKVLSFDMAFPHQDRKVYVLSRSRTGKDDHVEYANDLKSLISQLQQTPGMDIYCDGGAEIVTELLKNTLIDRLIVSVIPHLLGSGIRLFKDGRPETDIELKKCISFPSGLIQLWYERK
ncbi:MAG TPA: dihydrofolate reductase family protein [Bacteroidales bacterium]|nr:dihydrofolate reductase family protein [Bacteroidales bacterium]